VVESQKSLSSIAFGALSKSGCLDSESHAISSPLQGIAATIVTFTLENYWCFEYAEH
jgi:hypothetical protein